MKIHLAFTRFFRRKAFFRLWHRTTVFVLLIVPLLFCGVQTRADSTTETNPAVYKNLSLEQLMDVDVTSVARQPQPYGEAPAAIQVITGDEIERSGASSIPEALRLADNLDVAQKNSHDWAISARGFNTSLANKLLVSMDGRTIYSPLFAGVEWDQQDYLLADIDRIEVISGPGGTLWGANAMNGVINIVSKSAQDTQGLYVEGGGGNELRDFGGARYGGVLTSNVYYRVYGKYFDRNDEVLPDGNDAHDSWNSGQGGFRMDAPLPEDNFTLQGDYHAGHENQTPSGWSNESGGNVLGRWTHTFSGDSDASLQLYYDHAHFTVPITAVQNPFEPPGTLSDDLDTYDLDFQHRFHLNDQNNVVWGLGYRFTHEVDQNAPGLEFLPPTLNHNLFSGFVQDEIELFDDVYFTAGTKLEHNDYTGVEYEPSARLQWNVTTNQMVWAAVSRAVRMPSRVDENEVLTFPVPPGALLTGNSNFVSETMIAFELGYRTQLGEKISASISTFYNLYNDIRSANTNATTVFPLIFENDLKGETYGFELTADYQLFPWWRLHGGYDLLKENIYVKPSDFDFNAAHNETADPQQQIFLSSSMDLPWNLKLDANGRWIDTLTLNNGPALATVPSYFEMDARLAWQATKHIELSIVGQNLLHAQHQEYGYPGNPTTEEIVRSVYGKVTCRF